MSISRNQALRLLAYLAAVDHRPFDDVAADVWVDVATERRWSYDEAMAAVRSLVAQTTSLTHRIQPPDVTAVIVSRRNEAEERREAEEREARRSQVRRDPETTARRRAAVAAEVARIAGEHAVPGEAADHGAHMDGLYRAMGWSQVRRAALRYPCPHCRAPEGQGCATRGNRPRPKAEPHAARSALIIECPSCSAPVGATCTPGDDHPHHNRDRDAIGPQGLAARADVVETARASVEPTGELPEPADVEPEPSEAELS